MTLTAIDVDPMLLVHAYLDGELDSANALGMARRMATDPVLAAERDRIEALRRLIHRRQPPEAPPPDLRHRIETLLGMRRSRPQPSWRALAASIALTAIVASGSTFVSFVPRTVNSAADAIVSGHVRALMAPQAIDVASSDRHTVKPWFNGRIPEAPRVVDLARDGYPLVGGRLDVIAHTPVPTLVYRHRLHLISLTAMPGGGVAEIIPAEAVIDGYNCIRWRDAHATYWAVSDLAPAELQEFARLFRAAPAD